MSIINMFDSCRFWGNKRNYFFTKIKFYGFINWMVAGIANIILPIYFKITKNNPNYVLKNGYDEKKEKYIVSLTSFPARIKTVWLVIETMLRQTYKPDIIVLYLSKEQFPTMDFVPTNLKYQQKRGLKIVLCEDDLKSHKKYFYAIQDFPHDNIITIDDDIFYRTDFIESLINGHKQHPHAIIANWAKKIIHGKELYKEWPDADQGDESIYMVPIGVGGVLYPPHSLYTDFNKKEIFINNCFKADDIWLSCMSILQHTPKIINTYKFSHLPIIIRRNITLLDSNRTENQIQIDNLKRYYTKTIGINPFKNPSI